MKGAITPRDGALHGAATHHFCHGQSRSRDWIRGGQSCRDDVIIATGRSDYPNQVNNVLGFPFIFRGALDVHATAINEEMKLAATRALADLAKEDVPDSVCRAYGVDRLHFGRDYMIPKPFDPRVLMWEASAVAEAAMKTGVAQEPVELDAYREQLERRLGKAHAISRVMIQKAQAKPKQVVFPEGENEKILRACHNLVEEKIASPILIGQRGHHPGASRRTRVGPGQVRIVDPVDSVLREPYIQELFRLRQRRGVTLSEARVLINNPQCFRLDDVAHGRRRRAGRGRDATFSGHHSPGAANRAHARRTAQSVGLLRAGDAQWRSVFPGGYQRQH